jgi:hypothetical protein
MSETSPLVSILGGLAGAYAAKKADNARQDRQDAWLKAQYGDKYNPPARKASRLEGAIDSAGDWIKERLGSSKPAAEATPPAATLEAASATPVVSPGETQVADLAPVDPMPEAEAPAAELPAPEEVSMDLPPPETMNVQVA